MKKKMSLFRFFTMAIAMIMVFQTALPVQAATKKLKTPSGFDYFWAGDNLIITWDIVANADTYEMVTPSEKYTHSYNFYIIPSEDLSINKGKCSFELKVRALPKKNSNYTGSSYASIKSSVPTNDYKTITAYPSAMTLSKNDLIKWLKMRGETNITESKTSDGKYVVVSISHKDSNNQSGFADEFGAGLDGAVEEFLDAESWAESAWDAFLKDEDILDYQEAKLKEKMKQSANEYKQADKTKYYYYYYAVGQESYAAEFLIFDYLQRNNPKPSELLSSWGYDKDTGYYTKESISRCNLYASAYNYGEGTAKRTELLVKCLYPIKK